MENIRSMIVDTEIEAIDQLERLLLKFNNIKILPSISDPQNIVCNIRSEKPNILFMDIEISDKTGFEIIDELRKEGLNIAVVIVTSYTHYAIKAIKKKVYDYFLKPVDIEDLKNCIKRFLNEETTSYLNELSDCNLYSDLSKRENEIVDLVFKGYTSKNIAEKLYLSKHTIDFYRKNILQ